MILRKKSSICEAVKQIWIRLGLSWVMAADESSPKNLWSSLMDRGAMDELVTVVCTCYHIWQGRNGIF